MATLLGARVGLPPIPQVFIGGELIGGTAEVFDAARSGEMQRRLAGVAFHADAKVDYGSLLPKWLKQKGD